MVTESTPTGSSPVERIVSAHTPGPWTVQNSTDIFTGLGSANAKGICADNNDGWQIADCGVGITFVDGIARNLDFCEQKANAALMARAPTMDAEMRRYLLILERAEGCPELWDRLTKGTGIATLNGYRAALVGANAEVELPPKAVSSDD